MSDKIIIFIWDKFNLDSSWFWKED